MRERECVCVCERERESYIQCVRIENFAKPINFKQIFLSMLFHLI